VGGEEHGFHAFPENPVRKAKMVSAHASRNPNPDEPPHPTPNEAPGDPWMLDLVCGVWDEAAALAVLPMSAASRGNLHKSTHL